MFRIRWIGFPYKHCYFWLVLPARLHGFQNRDEVYFGEVKAPSMPVSILQRNIRIQYFFSWNKLTKGDSSSLGLFQLFVPPGFVASWCRSYRKLIPYFDVYKMVRTQNVVTSYGRGGRIRVLFTRILPNLVTLRFVTVTKSPYYNQTTLGTNLPD